MEFLTLGGPVKPHVAVDMQMRCADAPLDLMHGGD
jgi:hypothetical protein